MWQTWRKTYQILCPFFPMRQTWRETYQVLCLFSYSLKWDKHGAKHNRYYVYSLILSSGTNMARNIPGTMSVLSHATNMTWNIPDTISGAKHTRYYISSFTCNNHDAKQTYQILSLCLFSFMPQTWGETYQILCLVSPVRQTRQILCLFSPMRQTARNKYIR